MRCRIFLSYAFPDQATNDRHSSFLSHHVQGFAATLQVGCHDAWSVCAIKIDCRHRGRRLKVDSLLMREYSWQFSAMSGEHNQCLVIVRPTHWQRHTIVKATVEGGS